LSDLGAEANVQN